MSFIGETLFASLILLAANFLYRAIQYGAVLGYAGVDEGCKENIRTRVLKGLVQRNRDLVLQIEKLDEVNNGIIPRCKSLASAGELIVLAEEWKSVRALSWCTNSFPLSRPLRHHIRALRWCARLIQTKKL